MARDAKIAGQFSMRVVAIGARDFVALNKVKAFSMLLGHSRIVAFQTRHRSLCVIQEHVVFVMNSVATDARDLFFVMFAFAPLITALILVTLEASLVLLFHAVARFISKTEVFHLHRETRMGRTWTVTRLALFFGERSFGVVQVGVLCIKHGLHLVALMALNTGFVSALGVAFHGQIKIVCLQRASQEKASATKQ